MGRPSSRPFANEFRWVGDTDLLNRFTVGDTSDESLTIYPPMNVSTLTADTLIPSALGNVRYASDEATLQTAIDATSADGGGIVRLSSDITLTASISLKSNVVVSLSNATITSTGVVAFIAGTVAEPISDAAIIGPGKIISPTSAVFGRGSMTDIVVHNVDMRNCSTGAVFLSGGASTADMTTAAVTVSGTTFTSVTHGLSIGDQIYFASEDYINSILVAFNWYYVVSTDTADTFEISGDAGGTALSTGVFAGTDTVYWRKWGGRAERISLTKNRVQNSASGLEVHYATDVTIDDNIILDMTTDDALETSNVIRFSISRNRGEGCGTGNAFVDMANDAAYFVLTDNTFLNERTDSGATIGISLATGFLTSAVKYAGEIARNKVIGNFSSGQNNNTPLLDIHITGNYYDARNASAAGLLIAGGARDAKITNNVFIGRNYGISWTASTTPLNFSENIIQGGLDCVSYRAASSGRHTFFRDKFRTNGDGAPPSTSYLINNSVSTATAGALLRECEFDSRAYRVLHTFSTSPIEFIDCINYVTLARGVAEIGPTEGAGTISITHGLGHSAGFSAPQTRAPTFVQLTALGDVTPATQLKAISITATTFSITATDDAGVTTEPTSDVNIAWEIRE